MNLRNILLVASYEYRTHFRRKGFLFASFGLPLLGALILWGVRALNGQVDLGAMLLGESDKPLAVLDQAHLFTSLPEPFVAVSDLESGRQGVLEERYLGLLVIPPDYPQEEATLYTLSGQAAIEQALRMSRNLLAYAELQEHYTFEQVQRLLEDTPVRMVVLSETGAAQGAGARLMVGLTFSILFYITLFSTAGYLLSSVTQEKESRIIEILLSSVTALELLWGKVLGLGALGLTQVAIWLTSARLLARQATALWGFAEQIAQALRHPDPQLVLALVLVMPLSYLTYGLLMAGLGSLGNNLRESQQFSAAVTMIAAIPYMLNFFITLNPNSALARALSYFPLTAPTALILRLGVGTIPWWDFALAVGLTALGALFSLWVGVRLFRVGVLMYGPKPSWREVWRIIRNPA